MTGEKDKITLTGLCIGVTNQRKFEILQKFLRSVLWLQRTKVWLLKGDVDGCVTLAVEGVIID